MEQSEVLKRVIGILTQMTDWRRILEEDEERDIGSDPSVITALLSETLPRIRIPEDATHEEIANLVAEKVGGAIHQLVGAFTLAFVELAQVHDSGRDNITTNDVLRELALRAEHLNSNGGSDADGDSGGDHDEGPDS
ncbi:hypothetical protein ACFWU3_18705 [Streptomyces sp. NPDC058685]|uniref:hypothetical protein n=1 Tax=Streptomyces sp. NPDC058685 TaxID=3346598 RepID=UPI0036532878